MCDEVSKHARAVLEKAVIREDDKGITYSIAKILQVIRREYRKGLYVGFAVGWVGGFAIAWVIG